MWTENLIYIYKREIYSIKRFTFYGIKECLFRGVTRIFHYYCNLCQAALCTSVSGGLHVLHMIWTHQDWHYQGNFRHLTKRTARIDFVFSSWSWHEINPHSDHDQESKSKLIIYLPKECFWLHLLIQRLKFKHVWEDLCGDLYQYIFHQWILWFQRWMWWFRKLDISNPSSLEEYMYIIVRTLSFTT